MSGEGDEVAPAARPGRVLLESLPVGALAIGVASWLYRVWDQDWSQPFRTAGPDTTFIALMVRAIHEHGWYFHNPSLNAPFGQQFYDYPSGGETLQLALLRVLTLFVHDPITAINTYFLLGFGFLAMVTFAVFRHLRFGPVVSAGVALLYTFLPYHLWHMEDHLYRSTYASAPIACLLLLWALSWRSTFLRDPDGPIWGVRALVGNLRRKQVVSAVLLCAVVATFETMTIAFFLVTLGLASLVVAVRRRDPAQLLASGVAVAVVGCFVLLAFAPNLRYWHAHGRNTDIVKRDATEQEAFGLQPSRLLLPVPGHRLVSFDDARAKARLHSPLAGDEGGQELGLVGAVGLVALLWWGLSHGVQAKVAGAFHDRSTLRDHAALCTLILIPVATASGFALLLSINGFAKVRVWNRVVVLIGFFALLTVAIGLERLLARARAADRPRWLTTPVAVGLVVLLTAFGLWDTAVLRVPAGGHRAPAAELRAFVADVEDRLPDQAMIYQFPVTPFPELPAKGTTQEYDELQPYLASDRSLRWSAGGLRGRPDADWQLNVFAKGPVASLPGLRGLGFRAVEIDIDGFDDHGTAAVAELEGELGPAQVTSTSGRWKLWDLQAWARRTGQDPVAERAAARDLVGDLIDEIPARDRP